MATSARLARRPKASPAAAKAARAAKRALEKLYYRDSRAFHEETNDPDVKYAGIRAWLDGYNAGKKAR